MGGQVAFVTGSRISRYPNIPLRMPNTRDFWSIQKVFPIRDWWGYSARSNCSGAKTIKIPARLPFSVLNCLAPGSVGLTALLSANGFLLNWTTRPGPKYPLTRAIFSHGESGCQQNRNGNALPLGIPDGIIHGEMNWTTIGPIMAEILGSQVVLISILMGRVFLVLWT